MTLLSRDGHYYGRLIGSPLGNGAVRLAQYAQARNAAYALDTGRQIVHGKLHNMRVFLLRYARREEDEVKRPRIAQAAGSILGMMERVPRTQTLNSLLGVEGQGTALYFGTLKYLLHRPWTFEMRVRRPPTDPVNVLLSFGYTVLTQIIQSAVLAAGLDPYIGFLHQVNYNRPSLPLDLVEEFRPLIVDSIVLRCLNNEIVRPEDFTPGEDPADRPLMLGDEGKRRFIREIETRLAQKFKHPRTGEQVDYRRLFMMQVYHLVDCLKTGALYRPFTVH